MATNVEIWAHRGFDGGLVTSVPAHAVDDDCSPDAENFDPSEWYILRKRLGYTNFVAAHGSPTGTRIRGLFSTVFEDGTIKMLAKEGTAVYDVTAGNWSTVISGHPALQDADEVHFSMYKNLVVMTSEEAAPIAPQKWTGSGAFSNLGGSPPAAKFSCVHKGRLVLGGTSVDPSRLYFSALNNAEDWSTADNATNMFVSPGDGMTINGLISDGQVLYVSKKAQGGSEGSLYAIIGNGPADFQPPVRIAYFGAPSQRAMVLTHTFAVVASRQGIWGLTVGQPLVRMSLSVDKTLADLTNAQIDELCVGRYKDQVWITYNGGSSYKTLVVDTFFQRWSRYSPTPFRMFTTHPDGTLYGASNTSTLHIMKLNNGATDLGTNVTMYWNTPDLDFGKWFFQKKWQKAFVHTANQAVTWTWTMFVDGVSQSTFSVVGGADPVDRIPPKGSDKWGRFIRMKMEENSSSLRGELYGLECEVEMAASTR